MRFVQFIFVVLFSFNAIVAQEILPANGSSLNYTQVLFQVNEVPFAVVYSYVVKNKTTKKIINKLWSTNVVMLDQFNFGDELEWFVTAKDAQDNLLYQSEIYHFSIQKNELVDSSYYKYDVNLYNRDRSLPGIIFLDNSSVAINREGKPVWFLPEKARQRYLVELRDLKMTNTGNITYLNGKLCKEIDLLGNVQWELTGQEDSLEGFHHEISKLNNGNILALSRKKVELRSDSSTNSSKILMFTQIVEYNPMLQVVWKWSSENQFTNEDVELLYKKVSMKNTFGHSNSISQSKDGKYILVSFRELSELMLIEKSTGTVVKTYGDHLLSDTSNNASGFFHFQHSARLLDNGEIALFNNNYRDSVSSVLILTDGLDGRSSSKVWEYKCDQDTKTANSSYKMGNIQLLPNSNYLVNMGSTPDVFEVTPHKEIVWNCVPYVYDAKTHKWEASASYRANFQSSLYPTYFSVTRKKDGKGRKYLWIQNEGSDTDSYTVKVTENNETKEFTITVLPHAGYSVYPAKKKLKSKVEIKVVSQRNPLLEFRSDLTPY